MRETMKQGSMFLDADIPLQRAAQKSGQKFGKSGGLDSQSSSSLERKDSYEKARHSPIVSTVTFCYDSISTRLY